MKISTLKNSAPKKNERPLVLGIDPGLTGAIAVLEAHSRRLVACYDMPVKEGKKRHVDAAGLGFIIGSYASEIAFATVEDVHAMPEQGVVSTFRFGQALGVVEGVLGSYCVPSVKFQPAVWKSLMHVTADKSSSITLAKILFSDKIALFGRKKDDGRAEAALLAACGVLFTRGRD